MQRLVLFDIDGTLLTTNGAAARAFLRALRQVFGTAGPVESHSFAGKTDPQIAHELLSAAGLAEAGIEAGLPALWEAYLAEFEREILHAEIHVYPGVMALLDRVERAGSQVAMGLLTGNIQPGARLKLETAGIGADRFAVGAYGSDHARRSELPRIAVERAERRFGHRFAGKSIVIIGDTPADVACGESLGVRTIAVATGSFTEQQLAGCGPDHLFPSLADVDAVWEAIFT